jgi:hypothetical protein
MGSPVLIGGDPELEARYREWLPVVEIDGERAFVYHVPAGALRRKLAHKVPRNRRVCTSAGESAAVLAE